MIHPLHSCKGKGVKHDRRERKKEVVNGFRLAVHDAWRCADIRAIEICKLEARYLFDKSSLGIVSDKTLCTESYKFNKIVLVKDYKTVRK